MLWGVTVAKELGVAGGGVTTPEWGKEFGRGNVIVLRFDSGDSFMMAFTGRNSPNRTRKRMNFMACKVYLHQKIKITPPPPQYHNSLVLGWSPGIVS